MEGETISLSIQAGDADGNPLTFGATNLPPGLSIDPNTGGIAGTIANTAAAGSPYTVTVTASDGTADTSIFFVWTVSPSNNNVDEPLTLRMTALPDPVEPGGLLTYTLTVGNQGGTDLTGVVLGALVPDHTDTGSSFLTGGGGCSNCGSGGQAGWTFGTLLVGESRTVEMTVGVDGGSFAPPDGTLLRSSARVFHSAGGFIAVSETYTRVCTGGETVCDVLGE